MKLLRYLWPSPYSLIGLCWGGLAVLLGDRARIRDGTIGFHGRFIRLLLNCTPLGRKTAALTIGHVIFARNHDLLEFTHPHEMVHVRQFERWGIAMAPAYLIASARVWFRGGDPYRENPFEVEAFAVDDLTKRSKKSKGTQ